MRACVWVTEGGRERTNDFFINEGNGISTILFSSSPRGERKRERDRQTDRQTETQRDRQTDRQRQRGERQTDRQRQKDRDKERERDRGGICSCHCMCLRALTPHVSILCASVYTCVRGGLHEPFCLNTMCLIQCVHVCILCASVSEVVCMNLSV